MSDTRPPTPNAEPDKVSGHLPTPPADRGKIAEVITRSVPPPAKPRIRAAKHSMADLLVGTVLADRYRLVEKVGEGAMGWVFLAEHVDIRKKFAVKVLRPSLCRLNEAVSRFKREARAASSIGSQHIVDVTDFGQTNTGAAFFVMEHLVGEDFSKTLAREKRLPWKRAHAIVLQLCDALQAAHDAGIVHRDVKPANIYRIKRGDNDDFVKVLDFGIARLANPTDSIVTQTGVVMGTPDFMAPEQALGRRVDHRADIYSLGATAYALLTGKPPFVGKNEYDVIYKQLNEEPKPLREILPDLPKWAEAAILKAMRKSPDERYATMREFGEALQNPPAESETPEKTDAKKVVAKKAAPAKKKSSKAKRPAKRGMSPIVWVAAFVLLAAGGGAAVTMFLR
ncbi:MAG: serine/threonine protein kinase [Nannocystaceae bacterium]|nr:serine/threonine protein kinase [Nannocystaceae bacterium]